MRHLLIALLLIVAPIKPGFTQIAWQETPAEGSRVEKIYDRAKGKTILKLSPVKVAGEVDKYHSVHMSPSFSYPGHKHRRPSVVDFELQTVVKGSLKTDLYVVFIVDGETIFLSSSRWGIKRPVPGRVWMGERLVFHMPYETWLKITKAKQVEIKMDDVRFELSKPQRQVLRDFEALVSFASL